MAGNHSGKRIGMSSGTWKLTLREMKPEFVGLLVEAVEFLNAHSAEFAFQVGGSRNFGRAMRACG